MVALQPTACGHPYCSIWHMLYETYFRTTDIERRCWRTMNRYPEADIVTALDIATRLGVKHRTVYKWRQRGMPEPDFMLRPPLWRWVTIEAWAKATGRLE